VSAQVTDKAADDATADVKWFAGGNIAVTVTPVADAPAFTVTNTETVAEDSFVALDVAAAVTDTDGSESITAYKLAGLPEGATIKYMDGETPVEVTIGASGEVEIAPAHIGSVEVKAPANSSNDMTIAVSAQVTDKAADDATADVKWFAGGNIAVTVTPVADAPAFTVTNTETVAEDSFVALDVAAAVTDTDGSESITAYKLAGLPEGATIKYMDGETPVEVTIGASGEVEIAPAHIASVEVKAPANSSNDMTIAVSAQVTDKAADDATADVKWFAGGNIAVNVVPVVDTDLRDIKLAEGGKVLSDTSKKFGTLLADEGAGNGDWVSSIMVNGVETAIAQGGSVTVTMGDDAGNPIGDLTVESDGSWSFTSDDQVDNSANGQKGNIKDFFQYRITDAEGDVSALSAEQKIQVNDTVIKASDDNVSLDEAGVTTANGNVLDNDNQNGGVDVDPSVVKFIYIDENGFSQTAMADAPAVTTQFGTFSLGTGGVYSYEVNGGNADHDQIFVAETAGSRKDWSGVTGLEGLTAKNNGIRLTDGNDNGDAHPSTVTMTFTAGAAEAVRFEVVGFKNVKEGGTWEALDSEGEVVASGSLTNGFITVLDASGPISSVRFTADAELGTNAKSDFYIRSLEGTRYEAVTDDSITDTVRYQITDSDGDKKWAAVNIEIADDNTIEALSQTPLIVTEGDEKVEIAAVEGLLSDDTIGADGGRLTSFTIGEHTYNAGETAVIDNFGSLTVNEDGSWSFAVLEAVQHDPDKDVSDLTFQYHIVDSDGDTSSADQVISVNDTSPTAQGTSYVYGELDIMFSFATILYESYVQSMNIEGGADGIKDITIAIANVVSDYDAPEIISHNEQTDLALINVPANFNGSFDFVVTVTDNDGDEITASNTFTINPVNDIPFGLTVSNQGSITENVAAAIELGTVTATDPDVAEGDQLTFTVNDPRFEVREIDGTHKLFLKANNAFDFETEADVTLTLTAEDSAGATTQLITTVNVIDVNEQPVAANDTIITNDADGTVDVSISALLGNDSDVDGDTLSINGLTSGVVALSDGDTYTVEDNHPTNELTDTATVSVIVDSDQTIEGTSGNEIFVGGEGDEVLTGNGGDDTFAYNSMNDGDDTITDFASGDVIDLDALFDALGVTDDATRATMVKETQDGNDAVIGIDTDNDGQAEDGFSITLKDTHIDEVTFDETTSTIVADES
jgi:hypothetical protein